MKFGGYLKSIEDEAPAEFKGRWLQYKKLKKNIKHCRRGRADNWQDLSIAEKAFFTELEKEVHLVNRQFEAMAQKLIAARTTSSNHSLLNPLRCFTAFGRHMLKPRDAQRLARQAHWCREYAKVNAIGLRKILKKHDKKLGNSAGREFLQTCWEHLEPGHGTFLHSPLLDELKALEKMMDLELNKHSLDSDNAFRSSTEGDQSSGGTGMSQASHGPAHLSSRQLAAIMEQEGEGVQDSLHGSMIPPTTVAGAAPSMHVSEHTADALEAMSGSGDALQVPGLAAQGAGAGAAAEAAEPMDADPPFNGRHGKGVDIVRQWLTSMSGDDTSALISEPDSRADSAAQAQAESMHPSTLHKTPSIGSDDDTDWTCPICLEILYKPIGLGCGHKFCKRCALRAAGMGKVLGRTHAVLSHIPAETKCPECRQMWVYQNALQLKRTDEWVRNRFPEAWAARQQEERDHVRQVKAEIRESQAEEQGFSYGL